MLLEAVCTHVTSAAALGYSAVKFTTDSNQFWIAHKNLRVTFQTHSLYVRKKREKYGDAFSKSSSIIFYVFQCNEHVEMNTFSCNLTCIEVTIIDDQLILLTANL